MFSLLDKQFIFIIGAPRSGTTWLHAMIAEHPSVCATEQVELTFFSDYLPPITKRWNLELDNMEQGRWIKGLPYLWNKEKFDSFIDVFFREYYSKLVEKKPTATHVIDKNPAYSFHTSLIHHLLPNAKFINIIRDGRNVTVSMASVSSRVGFGGWDVNKGALDWRVYIENARKAIDFGTDKYLEIRYEDLQSDGTFHLKKIFEFCNLTTNNEIVRKIYERNHYTIKKFSSPNPDLKNTKPMEYEIWRKKLPPMQKYVFHKVAGRLLRELKYADESWWYKNNIQKIFLICLYYFNTANKRLKEALNILFR